MATSKLVWVGPPRRLLTVAEVSALTGLSRAAIEGRIKRGTLPATRSGGRPWVSLVSLYQLGLMPGDLAATVADLLDRLEAQAVELGRLRERLGDS